TKIICLISSLQCLISKNTIQSWCDPIEGFPDASSARQQSGSRHIGGTVNHDKPYTHSRSRTSSRKMVNYCRVLGCTNRSDQEKHLEYYRLPKLFCCFDMAKLT
uniref:Uncharacterized protein n=1 Tax=Myripristis murdjan TaxID=586833 RepID=A0A667XC08_9TELE